MCLFNLLHKIKSPQKRTFPSLPLYTLSKVNQDYANMLKAFLILVYVRPKRYITANERLPSPRPRTSYPLGHGSVLRLPTPQEVTYEIVLLLSASQHHIRLFSFSSISANVRSPQGCAYIELFICLLLFPSLCIHHDCILHPSSVPESCCPTRQCERQASSSSGACFLGRFGVCNVPAE